MGAEADPVSFDARSKVLALKAMTINALVFQRPDSAFGRAVLQRAARRDELSPKTITANEARNGAMK